MADNPNSCGAAPLANELLPLLVGGKSFELPEIDFDKPEYKIPDLGDITKFTPPPPLTNEDLTTRVVGGDGTFDAIMDSINNHVKKVFEKNAITGETFAQYYVQSLQAGMSAAVSFLLGRDQAHWQSVLAQQQAILAQVQVQTATIEMVNARVGLETTKAQYYIARAQALNTETEYAINKMRLATEDANYCLVLTQIDQAKYTIANLLPAQKDNLVEQIEVQRAQTLDIRKDGEPVKGVLGKQKELYDQQITSFKRDAENKAARIFAEAWNMMKSVDEGLLAPTELQNESYNGILRKIKEKNDLV